MDSPVNEHLPSLHSRRHKAYTTSVFLFLFVLKSPITQTPRLSTITVLLTGLPSQPFVAHDRLTTTIKESIFIMKLIILLVTMLTSLFTRTLALPTSKHPLDTYPESESPKYYDLVTCNSTSPASPLSYSVIFNCQPAIIAYGANWKLKVCGYQMLTPNSVSDIYVTPSKCETLCYCSCSTDLTYAYCDGYFDCDGSEVKEICTRSFNANGPVGSRGARCRCWKQGGSAGEIKREIDGPAGDGTTCG